jgi:hypothetical protein
MRMLANLELTLETMRQQDYNEIGRFRQSLELLKYFYAKKQSEIQPFEDKIEFRYTDLN